MRKSEGERVRGGWRAAAGGGSADEKQAHIEIWGINTIRKKKIIIIIITIETVMVAIIKINHKKKNKKRLWHAVNIQPFGSLA